MWLINVPINFMWKKLIWEESHKTWNKDLVFLQHTPPYRAYTSHSHGMDYTFSEHRQPRTWRQLWKHRGFLGDCTLSAYLPPYKMRSGRNLENRMYVRCCKNFTANWKLPTTSLTSEVLGENMLQGFQRFSIPDCCYSSWMKGADLELRLQFSTLNVQFCD